MRWIWIDRIITLEKAQCCVAIKNISLAEEVLHDHFPATPARPAIPVMPNTLLIEGMAQTAGILVGHANGFSQKVILAKITCASFTQPATAGHTLRYTARMQRMGSAGASTAGQVELIDSATGQARDIGQVDLMFSHIDQNRSGLVFPKHNFVFTEQFMELIRRSGFPEAARIQAGTTDH